MKHRRRRAGPEEMLQRAVVQYLRVALPERMGVIWYAVAGQRGTRKRFEMGILKAMGVRAGIPDLAFIVNRRPFFIELKAPKGTESEAQKEMFPKLRKVGAPVHVCRSLTEVEAALKAEGIEPAGRAV